MNFDLTDTFSNPFRPGAGHMPPYLAGRRAEREEFVRLLHQGPILENLVLTGLRGVGKTVLLDSLKALAARHGWVWVGADLSESASISEDSLAVRLLADLSPATSDVIVDTEEVRHVGFTPTAESVHHRLGYGALSGAYERIPGLSLDKLKGVLGWTWRGLSGSGHVRGIIFAYDEAQNLTDQSAREQYPLSLMLDCFQSLQRQGLPLMLVLAGLPTLFPKLVEARPYSERMFRVVLLQSLDRRESEEAIRRPLQDAPHPIRLSDSSVEAMIDMSGGYPYFLQFIGREVYDAFIHRTDRGADASVPAEEIERKLDADFFAGRWSRVTDRQRQLMVVISRLDSSDSEFTVQEVVAESARARSRPFSGSHVIQMLAALASQGLVYRIGHGRYAFAVPQLGRFIRRQTR